MCVHVDEYHSTRLGVGTYLCVHMCIVMYLHEFKHMLSMCVLGIDECVVSTHSLLPV